MRNVRKSGSIVRKEAIREISCKKERPTQSITLRNEYVYEDYKGIEKRMTIVIAIIVICVSRWEMTPVGNLSKSNKIEKDVIYNSFVVRIFSSFAV